MRTRKISVDLLFVASVATICAVVAYMSNSLPWMVLLLAIAGLAITIGILVEG